MISKPYPWWFPLDGDRIQKPMALLLPALLERLGPTYIKLGQLLSSRPDLVPEPFLSQLSRLQDHTRSFSRREAEEAVQSSLPKKRALELLASLSEAPLAAGAFAQVYRGSLPKGQAVAVKIQRPNLNRQVARDWLWIRACTLFLDQWPRSPFRLSEIAELYREALLAHLDFRIEARNARRFRKHFQHNPAILFPEVFSQYSSAKVLTMTYFEGCKLPELSSTRDPKPVLEKGLMALLEMLLVHGFVHADLHAGNLLVLPDDRLAYLDLGLVASLSLSQRRKLFRLMAALAANDQSQVLSALFQLLNRPDFPYSKWEEALAPLVQPYLSASLAQIELKPILLTFLKTIASLGLTFPSSYALAFLSLASIEGAAKSALPTFRPFEAFSSFFSREP